MLDDRYAEDYRALLSLFLRLGQAQAGRKIARGEGWLYDTEVLAIKLFRHLLSVEILARPTVLEAQPGIQSAHVDHASVKVVARAALETYLVFYFIYVTGDVSLSRFRHDAWHLAGLIDRQELQPMADEHRAKMADELKEITVIRSQLEASPHFQAYSEKQRARLLKGDWLIGYKWGDLGKLAGFHDRYFQNIYSYLCGYAHTSYASAMQVGQARDIKDQSMLADSILGIGLVIMAHFAFAYVKAMPDAEKILNADTALKQVAERWHLGTEDMEEVWGAKRD